MINFIASGWQELANNEIVDTVAGTERAIVGNVLNIIRIFGSGMALVMLAWMSISYFAADGSSLPFAIERRANIKGQQLWKFAVGVAIFIGASNILYFFSDAIMNILEEIFK